MPINWTNIHYGHPRWKTECRTCTLENESGDDVGFLRCNAITEDQFEITFEVFEGPTIQWNCHEVLTRGKISKCLIRKSDSDFVFELSIPQYYHVPKIADFADDASSWRLAKVGRRQGDFFLVNRDEETFPWNAQPPVTPSGCLNAFFFIATFGIVKLTSNDPVTGSEVLVTASEALQEKAVILNSTIRFVLFPYCYDWE